jgi:outer membrane protein OmpA-like peptidoglycan-associated protein
MTRTRLDRDTLAQQTRARHRPAADLAGARSAARQAPPAVLQRYRAVNATAYGLTPDTAPGARAPFTLASPDLTPLPRTGGGAGLGMGYAQATPAQPPLLVADDDSLAINAQQGEPKEFYARGDRLAAARTALADVGSPVDLQSAGNAIDLPTGGHLTMVQPTLRDAVPPGQAAFVALANTICRDAAKEIVGGGLTHARVGRGDQRAPVRVVTSGSQVVGGLHELGGALAQGPVDADTARGHLAAGQSEQTRAPELTGKAYGEGVHGGRVGARARGLGLNEAARADVGEAYVTQSIGSAAGTNVDYSATGVAQANAFVWGYHYAAVVAESGDRADRVTMENYNRSGDVQQGTTALLQRLKNDFAAQVGGLALAGKDSDQVGQILHFLEHRTVASVDAARAAYRTMYRERMASTGAMWYFRMVGSQGGQSFHEQQAASGYFANPMTAVVANLSLPSESGVMFTQGSADLDPAAQAKVQQFARVLLTRIRGGATVSKVTVEGHASGSGLGLTRKKLAQRRATAVRALLIAAGVDGALIELSTGNKNAWGAVPAANRRVVLSGQE